LVHKTHKTSRDWNKIPKPSGNEGIVGYTFVVGDLFHYGHLNHLRKCRRYCDFLIVGVYTDELTMEYKRKPIFPFRERIELIKALKLVDMVVKVNAGERDQTYPMKRLVEAGWKLKILFHANDWDAKKDKDLVSAKNYIESIGGELIQPPYTKGVSTTQIIKKIGDRYCGFTITKEEINK